VKQISFIFKGLIGAKWTCSTDMSIFVVGPESVNVYVIYLNSNGTTGLAFLWKLLNCYFVEELILLEN
jgi:hypothetical protein